MSNDINNLEGEQAKAFDIAIKPNKKTIIIAGYAGTGKTTILTSIAKYLGNKCIVMSPTNKAAIVLNGKGVDAKTIHSVLYSPIEEEIYKLDKDGNRIYHVNSDGSLRLDEFGRKIPIVTGTELSFLKREGLELPKIALIDEASMINEDIRADLENTFEHLIYFGDPAQLPPIKGKDIFANELPDIFLTEVHRQAIENPIIRYATSIRNDEEIPIEKIVDGESLFSTSINNRRIISTIVEKDVQAICWTNRMRHKINQDIREHKGYSLNKLNDGESIISLQNVYMGGNAPKRDIKIYNGQIFIVDGNYEPGESHFDSQLIMLRDPITSEIIRQRAWPFWNGNFFNLKDNYQSWRAELDSVRLLKSKKITFGTDFDFSYCLTAHKAQGAEFDNVAVWDQRSRMKANSKRWFYTAVTRAKNKLLIIR
jgi:exodeoxyribonuclease-5